MGSIMLLSGVQAQPWIGQLDTSRATDWSGAGVVGGIPARSSVCASLTASATTATMNAAIATCDGSGGVLSLAAGTYTFSAGFKAAGHSSFTIRGAGPTQTILRFTGADGCGGLTALVCLQNTVPLYDGSAAVQPGGTNAATWSGGYAQGTTSITLTSVGSSPPQINDLIILDQANDVTNTGGMEMCDKITTCSLNGGAFGRVIGGVSYSQEQVVKVTGISGSTYTIDPPLRAYNWRVGQTPGAWWSNNPVHDVGIENLTIDADTNSPSSTVSVSMYNCLNCWMKNIRSIRSSSRANVLIIQSAHDEVRDSYFYAASGGSVGVYVLETDESSDVKVENNIFDRVGSPVVNDGGVTNYVFGYNYTVANIVFSSSTVMPFIYLNHGPNMFELAEGNNVGGFTSDTAHGGGPLNTLFRNWVWGNQPAPNSRTQQTWAIYPQFGARAWNIVGNVLGTVGYHNQYEVYTPSVTTNCSTSVYILGWSDAGCSNTGAPGGDSVVRSSMMRWGNYDVVNAAVRWDSTESSPGAITWVNANTTPASHTLPNSYYLSSKPSFFNLNCSGCTNPPWPATGPDVSGGTGPGGFSYLIPAAQCFGATAVDPTYTPAISFDASTCYAGSPAVAGSQFGGPRTQAGPVTKK